MARSWRVADAIRSGWEAYESAKALPPHAVKAVRHILRCRTAALGGHIHACDRCGSETPVYNSCQTRHCPSCQTQAREDWLDARSAELLPAQYFHSVFTLPHSLNPLVDANRKLLLGELFAAVNWVLQRFAADPQWRLEGELGFVAILHTWTQKLMEHFHVHCLIPGGVWREGVGQWIPCRGRWLFRKDSLADAFRNRFIRRLRALRKRCKLAYGGRAAALAEDPAWEDLIENLSRCRWVVYPKATAKNPAYALDYLARYTYKVAIGDHRIRKVEDGRVVFSWRDRGDGNALKQATLPAEEFVRRFCAHILPNRFHKIRYYGWMSAARRKAVLAAIRDALQVPPPDPPPDETLAERILRRTGRDILLCPRCGQGPMRKTDRRISPVRPGAP
jgi:hypothetical protein